MCNFVRGASFIQPIHRSLNPTRNNNIISTFLWHFPSRISSSPTTTTFHWVQSPFPFLKSQRAIQVLRTLSRSLRVLSNMLALEYFALSRAVSFTVPAYLDLFSPCQTGDIRSGIRSSDLIFQDVFCAERQTWMQNICLYFVVSIVNMEKKLVFWGMISQSSEKDSK